MKSTRGWRILFGVLAFAYIAAGLSRISFNIDILRLLPSHMHQVEGLTLFLKNFAQPDELLVTVECGDPDAAASASGSITRALSARPDLVASAVAEPPWESDPSSIAEFVSFILLNQSEEKAREIVNAISVEHAETTLQNAFDTVASSVSPTEIALLSYDPFRLIPALDGESFFGEGQQSEFSSKDGRFRIVYVRAATAFANYRQTAEWLHKIRGLCAEAAGSGVRVGFTGEPAFVAEISTGMERDMMTSALGTLAIISLIFWLCYGDFAPLRRLLAMLLLTFLLALATAGLLLDQITVIGAGFASVMIGLSVDYGYLIHQKSLRHSGSLQQLQWSCLQNILWTSSTTAAAFFALTLSSLPGLSQLGTLVGIGICIGALVMLTLFARLCMGLHSRSAGSALRATRIERFFESAACARRGERIAFALVALLLGALALKGFPRSDFSAATFRLKQSEAQNALETLYSKLSDDRGLLSLIVKGRSTQEVLSRLRSVQERLAEEKSLGTVMRYFSPLPIWPDVARQQENLSSLSDLGSELPRLERSASDIGFSREALALTSGVFLQLKNWAGHPLPLWPENPTSRWIMRRIARHSEGNFLALGMVEASPGSEQSLAGSFNGDGIFLVSWSTLGSELRRTMPREILLVSTGLFAAIILILGIGLRSFRAVFLFVATTLLVLACLAGAMSLLGMSWGFFNLAAVLLLLGTGTDYAILLLLALKRNGGDAAKARRDFSLVIFLCCTSAAAGFGSLAWASHAGLASLGKTCALGLLIDGVISLFLLPKAWKFLHAGKPSGLKQ